MVPFIPPEMCDAIAVYLQDDRDALKRISLVSRSWVHRSRTYLFRSMTILDEAQWSRLESLLDIISKTSARTSIFPCIDYVRSLSLRYPISTFFDAPSTCLSMGQPVLAFFKRLDTLTLDGVSQTWDHQHVEQLFDGSAGSLAHNIRTLRLRNITFSDPDLIFLLLIRCSQLSEIFLFDVVWSKDSPEEPQGDANDSINPPKSLLSPIETLNIRNCASHVGSSIAEWIMCPPFAARIHELHIVLEGQTLGPGSPDGDLCAASDASLETMHLHVNTHWIPDDMIHGKHCRVAFLSDINILTCRCAVDIPLPDLSRHHRLKSICLHRCGMPMFWGLGEWFYSIATRLNPPNLEELSLYLDQHCRLISQYEWALIDEHFAQFARTRPGVRIHFLCAEQEHGSNYMPEGTRILSAMHKALPKLQTHCPKQVMVTIQSSCDRDLRYSLFRG